VKIEASMYDRFLCGLSKSLSSESHDDFTEYWTFIRRYNPQGESAYRNVYSNNTCPQCGAPLPLELGERGNCPACNALVNSGEFDWVLTTITQASDWAEHKALAFSTGLEQALQRFAKHDPNFSPRLLEDKAANAFLQILCAQADLNPLAMRRFTQEKAFQALSAGMGTKTIAYNRLWLNQVQLIGAWENKNIATVAMMIQNTFQRVKILEKRHIECIDPVIRSQRQVLLLSRQIDAQPGKGSLYQHQCPSCGATIADSLDTECPYCMTPFSGGNHEWTVSDLLSMSEYLSLAKQQDMQLKIRLDAGTFDQLMDVRDYAFNNFMVMIAADGIFAQEERQMAYELAKRLGYKIDDMESLFSMAANGRLALRMPENSGKQQKIIQLLEDAAIADGSISKEEQKILDYLKTTYGEGK
jgi:rubrerythrin